MDDNGNFTGEYIPKEVGVYRQRFKNEWDFLNGKRR